MLEPGKVFAELADVVTYTSRIVQNVRGKGQNT